MDLCTPLRGGRSSIRATVRGMLLIWSLLILILALGFTALLFWIGYRLVVSAVRSGVLEANAEQSRRDQGLPPTRWSILSARPESGTPTP